ncbi:unnamed protein product [Phytophthora lilii]|uniref:Unnamed protein product n=1 Tax=Phytophthora lilii TaxID=2077276 RepID=A0A9W6U5U4_9STRA|nr:unnamed protein product [Phytophthora lilii]
MTQTAAGSERGAIHVSDPPEQAPSRLPVLWMRLQPSRIPPAASVPDNSPRCLGSPEVSSKEEEEGLTNRRNAQAPARCRHLISGCPRSRKVRQVLFDPRLPFFSTASQTPDFPDYKWGSRRSRFKVTQVRFNAENYANFVDGSGPKGGPLGCDGRVEDDGSVVCPGWIERRVLA